MSRRPDPLETRITKGNPGRRPLPDAPPERVDTEPQPPDWMDGHALWFWKRTSGLLFLRGQLTADGEASLVALCQCYAEWMELNEDLRVNGRFQKVKTKAGAGDDDDEASYMERARPALSAFQDCDRRLKGWLIEFGLTDASRGKVSGKASAPDGDDPLAKYGLN